MTTGEKLQKLRKDNEYTQEELADIMSVSRQSISKWESDVAFPETDKLVTLSKLYHCSIDYLLNDEVSEKGKKDFKSKKEFNKRKLPFIIFTLSFYFFTYFIYFMPFMRVETGTYYDTFSSMRIVGYRYYNLYTMLVDSYFDNANFWPAMMFMAGLIAQGLSITFIFVDSRGFNIAIKILNGIYMCFAYSVFVLVRVADSVHYSWSLILFIVAAVVTILQIAVPQFLFTRKKA